MRPRFLLPLLLALVVALVSGCGSSGGAGADAAVQEELSYFPSGSPVLFTVATDPNSSAVTQAQDLENRFPLAAFGQTALMSRLAQLGINYQNDVRPLFGHPLMAGVVADTIGNSSSPPFLAVWVTADGGKLNALLKKLGLQPVGSHDGASLYAAGSTAVGVSGSTLLVSRGPAVLNAALDRHGHGGGITASQYQRETSGLPSDSLVQVFGDLSGVLQTPRAARARSVPWVAALRAYGIAVKASSGGVNLRFHLDTTGAKLSDAQLPFASGSATPTLAASEPITAGIHDPSQIFSFAEGAEQAASPAGYQSFLRREAAVRAKTGVDLTSFAKLLTGDLVIGSDTHTTLGRVGVSDASTARQDLDKLMSTPSSLFSRAEKVRRLAGGFYAIQEHARTINVGLVGTQLVAGNAPPEQLNAFAAAPTSPASGAQGTLAFRVDLGRLLALALKHPLPKVAQSFLSQLSDLTGWGSASSSGMDGSATLGVK